MSAEKIIQVLRYSDNGDSSIGLWFFEGIFACHSLEDEFREVKVSGETRILAGNYKIGLRKEGRHHNRYLKKYPDFHIGMLEILDVPNFRYILIHKLNREDQTDGCIGVGDFVNNNQIEKGFISYSEQAYVRFYKKVIPYIDNLTISIVDLDRYMKVNKFLKLDEIVNEDLHNPELPR